MNRNRVVYKTSNKNLLKLRIDIKVENWYQESGIRLFLPFILLDFIFPAVTLADSIIEFINVFHRPSFSYSVQTLSYLGYISYIASSLPSSLLIFYEMLLKLFIRFLIIPDEYKRSLYYFLPGFSTRNCQFHNYA